MVPATAGIRNDGPYEFGNDFSVNAGKWVIITKLGVFDAGDAPLVNSHTVEITSQSSGGTIYASVNISSGSGGTVVGNFVTTR